MDNILILVAKEKLMTAYRPPDCSKPAASAGTTADRCVQGRWRSSSGRRRSWARGDSSPCLPAPCVPHLLGPPPGKSTFARIIAAETDAVFSPTRPFFPIGGWDALNLRKQAGRERPATFSSTRSTGSTRPSRTLLPFVEDGTVTLFGTTTENPSFEIRNALLSRSRVLVLTPLSAAHVETIARRALADPERGLGKKEAFISPDALRHIVEISDGDARVALNALESAVAIAEHRNLERVDVPVAEEALRRKALLYDKDGEEHYNIISAFHKSLRGSDPDARCTGWRGCCPRARIHFT